LAGSGFDNAFGNGVACEAGDVVDVEFVHQLLAMVLNGLDADAHFAAICLLGLPSAMSLQHFGLAGGQEFRALLQRNAFKESFPIVVSIQPLGNGQGYRRRFPFWPREMALISSAAAVCFSKVARGARRGQLLHVSSSL